LPTCMAGEWHVAIPPDGERRNTKHMQAAYHSTGSITWLQRVAEAHRLRGLYAESPVVMCFTLLCPHFSGCRSPVHWQ
jgi:hypothetical protein